MHGQRVQISADDPSWDFCAVCEGYQLCQACGGTLIMMNGKTCDCTTRSLPGKCPNCKGRGVTRKIIDPSP